MKGRRKGNEEKGKRMEGQNRINGMSKEEIP
jgi:hypothetical protein